MSKQNIYQQFETIMNNELKSFFSSIEEDYKLTKNSLWNKWTTIHKYEAVAQVEKKARDPKKSNYQVFFSIQRNKITQTTPNITFGEISKRVSAMWKELPPEEKAKYVRPDINSTDNNITKKKPVETTTSEIVYNIPKSNDSKSRTKLELCADDEKEEDEDDYFFSNESESSDSLSDDGRISDDDLFVDED